MAKREMPDTLFLTRLKKLIGDTKPFSWGAKVGLTPGTFNRMWHEGVAPKAEHLEKIYTYTGVSLNWLILGVGSMYLSNDQATEPKHLAKPSQPEIDNNTQVEQTEGITEQMEQRMRAMENRIKELESTPDKAANG